MAENKKDGFYGNVNKFFQRLQNNDLIRMGDAKVTTLNVSKTEEEEKRRTSFQVFRQYLQQKNWSTKHIELYNEYRKMDETFPIAAAALKIFTQELCLSGDTIVKTPFGDFSIKELYQKGYDKNFFTLQVYNENWKRTEWGLCRYIKSNGFKKVWKLTIHKKLDEETSALETFKEISFKCTEDHKIMYKDFSFKKLSELKEGDEIFSFYKYTDPSCKCLEDVFQNAVIKSIEECEEEEEVFDLVNVEPNNHFSIKVSDYVYVEVHNCSKGDDGNIIKVVHYKNEVKKAVEECFFGNIKINSQGYLIAKEMLKFGNAYVFLNTRKGEGVIDLVFLPPEYIRIELLQNSKNLDDYKYNWSGGGGGSNKFEPWQIAHFKIIEDIENLPYGTSILRSVVDTWRRIVLMREAIIIYRITRAPQRYLFKIDTSGMSPDEALAYADEMEKSLDKKPLINPATNEIDFKTNPLSIQENIYMPTFTEDVGGVSVLEGASNLSDIEDFKIIKEDFFAGLLIPKAFLTFEESLCLSADTKIPLLSGETKTIETLSNDFNNGIKNWVYSTDENGNIVPGEIEWAGATKKVSELYEVELDNGEIIRSTWNHPFRLKNGEYKNASELETGESLMPFYTKITDTGKKSGSGYEKVWHNGKKKFETTHRVVSEYFDEDFYKKENDKEKRICHHKDFNKRNNNPENLKNVSQKEHIALHKKMAMKNLCSKESREKLHKTQLTKEYHDKLSNSIKISKRKAISETNKKHNKRKKMLDAYYKKGKEISKFGENYTRILNDLGYTFSKVDNYFNYKYGKKFSKFVEENLGNIYFNHKVKSIKKITLENEELVYDLTIKKYHNFAVSAGVFVHNCLRENTLVNTTDGIKTIKKIAEEFALEPKKKKYVLSCNPHGYQTTGKILWCKPTKEVTELTRVHLSNDCFEDVTPNHPFLLESMEYRCAFELKIGDRIKNIFDKEILVTSKEIIPLQTTEWVYDLEVEDIHNFALASEIFVHNSNKSALRCIHPETKILLLDGREISIEELSKETFKDNWVYTYDKETDSIIPSKIKWCEKTRLNAQLVKVTLDNGEFLITTPDHRFILKGGEEIQAQNLIEGDSLQAGYLLENVGKTYNHKVISVEFLNEKSDTYDLEVENENHNFLTSAGVFIHNSEDLRFGNAVKQYQNYFLDGLLHIAVVHLYHQGFSIDDINGLSLEMNISSIELKKMELESVQQKFETAKTILDTGNGKLTLMSYTQVLSEILGMTDEEIKTSFENQLLEKKMEWRMSQIVENGFYEEPEFDKKSDFDKKNAGADDIFSKLLFEGKDVLKTLKPIITESARKDIQKLLESRRKVANRNDIERIVKTTLNENYADKFLKDIGIK